MAIARKSRPRPRLYLDACALQQPFDRLTSAEERAEAACVLLLFSWSRAPRIDIAWSTVLEHETVARAPVERRAWSMFARSLASYTYRPEARQHARAKELEKRLKLGAFDALHVACAEALHATLVTVDRTFLARTSAATRLRVRVVDPVQAVSDLRRVLDAE